MKSLRKRNHVVGRRNAGALAICMALGSSAASAAEVTPASPVEVAAPEATATEGVGKEKNPGDETSNFHIGGYARTWASFNLQNPPETPANDRWDPSMLRASLMLDADLKTGPFDWKAIGRLDREYKTAYLQRLENQNKTVSPGGPGSNIMDTYNQGQLREFYVDYSPVDRVKLRIGKQQVVWGETDFFQAMDLVQGYDFRWRSFLERDSDELRKPLIMVNAKLDVPEANGSLQVLFRPGLDRTGDIGNTYDLSGGRWALQPNKGVDFLAPGALNYNFHNSDGDVRDKTGGLRWTGIAGPVGYSFAYLKTFNSDPIVNSSFAPSGQKPTGGLGDFIFPKIDVFGATLNGYVPAIDAVLSTEIVYTKDAPYNIGTNFFGGALPGFGGIMKKNTVKTMFRVDKTLDLKRFLGTSRPSFFSVQVFDKWIQDFKREDDLVASAGFGAPAQKHSTILTAILGLNYRNDKINPQMAVGTDVRNGGGFVIPSVEFVSGDHWRFVVEADLFWNRAHKNPGQVEGSTYLFGQLANNDQLVFRVTRQF